MKLRNLISLLILALVAITLIGCTGQNQNQGETPVDPIPETPTKYVISFESNGGSVVEAIEAEAGADVNAPANPTKNGHQFLGWYTDSLFNERYQFATMPKENITLYAKWSLNIYAISYEVGDGDNSDENPESYTVLQNDIRLAEPTYEDHYFAGWYLDSNYTNKITSVDTSSAQNIMLYAKWEEQEVINTYHIIYHLDGGTNGDNPTEFTIEDANITLKAPSKEEYNFKGWFKDQGFVSPLTTIDTSTKSDIDVYAKWEAKPVTPPTPTYKITYNLDGGKNGNNPVRYTVETESFDLENPTKTSCTFEGWYLDADFTQPVTTIDTDWQRDLEIYAKWFNGVTVVKYEFDFGIGKEYKFFHISDTHIHSIVTEKDQTAEDDWMNNSRAGYASSFSEKYDARFIPSTSAENFKNIVKFINQSDADAACFTGDIMDYYTEANFEFIDTEIRKVEVPTCYALGNHENPSSKYTEMFGQNEIGFTVVDMVDFEFVVLDDSTTNEEGYYFYTEAQYQALLVECAKNIPIIIVQHVPVLTTENCDSRLEKCGEYFYMDENTCDATSLKVLQLMCNNANIKMIICGHIHGGTMAYFAPGKPIITCSSGLIGIINEITIR